MLGQCIINLYCSLGQSYICQTRHHLVTRNQDHAPNEKLNQELDNANYLMLNSNHKINFDSPETIGHSNNSRKQRIKETLPIKIYCQNQYRDCRIVQASAENFEQTGLVDMKRESTALQSEQLARTTEHTLSIRKRTEPSVQIMRS